MLRWLCALVTGAVLSAFALLLVTAEEYQAEGPVVVEVTRSHGMHAGDFLVIGGWALAIVALVVLTLRAGRIPR